MNSKKYQAFDINVTSDFPLPELRETRTQKAELSLQMLAPADALDEYQWFHSWHSEQDPVAVHCAVAREPAAYRLRYPGVADFVIGLDLDRVWAIPVPGVPDDSIRHVFLDSALPRILGQRGHLIVHASAVVAPDGRGLAFLGGSGWGKSTLASAFYHRGFELVADDCLQLSVEDGRLVGIPAYSGSRLLQDSVDQLFPAGAASVRVSHYASKQRVQFPSRHIPVHTELRDLYLLNDPSHLRGGGSPATSIEQVSGAMAIITLLRRSFVLDVEDMAVAARRFELANQVVAAAPRIWTLCFPRDFNLLAGVVKSIASHGEQPGAIEEQKGRVRSTIRNEGT